MINVLYEDNQVLVVQKPQNVPTQEDESEDEDLLSMCKQYIKEKYNKPGNVFLGLVHRLDRPTGGVIVFARNSKSAKRLSEQIQNGTLKKTYIAIVEGEPRKRLAHLTNYLKKDEKKNKVFICPESEDGAKRADLEYTVLDTVNDLSLLQVKLFTGRSHQIRVQLSTIGNPIASDVKYGAKERGTKKLSLWAYKLEFEHPTKGEKMTFISLPNEKDDPWKYFNLNLLD